MREENAHRNTDDAIRARLYKTMLDALEQLSDIDLQRSLWLNRVRVGTSIWIGSFAEASCELFNDSGLAHGGRQGESPDFPPAIDSLFVELGTALSSVPTDVDAATQIEHPSMATVRTIAGRLYVDVQSHLVAQWPLWSDLKWRTEVHAPAGTLRAALRLS